MPTVESFQTSSVFDDFAIVLQGRPYPKLIAGSGEIASEALGEFSLVEAGLLSRSYYTKRSTSLLDEFIEYLNVFSISDAGIGDLEFETFKFDETEDGKSLLVGLFFRTAYKRAFSHMVSKDRMGDIIRNIIISDSEGDEERKFYYLNIVNAVLSAARRAHESRISRSKLVRVFLLSYTAIIASAVSVFALYQGFISQ